MKLLTFKLVQSFAIFTGWALFSAVAVIGAPLFLLWGAVGLLVDVWAFKPKEDRHA